MQSKSSAAIDSQASAPAQIEGNAVVEKRLPKVQTSRSGVYKSLDQGALNEGCACLLPHMCTSSRLLDPVYAGTAVPPDISLAVACLAVPFTPGQGIVTPSPTNMATYWYQAQYLGYTDPYSGFPAVWSPVS